MTFSGTNADRIDVSPEQAAFVAELARAHLWWEPAGNTTHGFLREVAQIMNLGRYEDILRLEEAVDGATLIAVMLQAQPGWFDGRSWEFWRGRLRFRAGADIPETPPRRRFADVAARLPRLSSKRDWSPPRPPKRPSGFA